MKIIQRYWWYKHPDKTINIKKHNFSQGTWQVAYLDVYFPGINAWTCFVLSHVPLFATLWAATRRLLCPWESSGKNTGVCCHALLQRILPSQGSNPCLLCLLHHRRTLYRWATEEENLNKYKIVTVATVFLWYP